MAVRGSSRVPEWVEPMLAKADGGRLRAGPEWAYEYKLDLCTRSRPVGRMAESLWLTSKCMRDQAPFVVPTSSTCVNSVVSRS